MNENDWDKPPGPWDAKPDPGEGHTQFPNILFDLELDPDEAIVLLALLHAQEDLFERWKRSWARPRCPLGLLLRYCFGLSPSSVLRIIDRLEKRGFIRLTRLGDEFDFSRISPNLDHFTDRSGRHAPLTTFEFPFYQRGDGNRELSEAQNQRWERLKRLDELASMPYEEYLLTSEWKARREIEIERANGRCELCNAGGPFHVHHRTYERRGNEAAGDLLVLCPPCHKTFHNHRTLA